MNEYFFCPAPRKIWPMLYPIFKLGILFLLWVVAKLEEGAPAQLVNPGLGGPPPPPILLQPIVIIFQKNSK